MDEERFFRHNLYNEDDIRSLSSLAKQSMLSICSIPLDAK